jgi:hypothetical protein
VEEDNHYMAGKGQPLPPIIDHGAVENVRNLTSLPYKYPVEQGMKDEQRFEITTINTLHP